MYLDKFMKQFLLFALLLLTAINKTDAQTSITESSGDSSAIVQNGNTALGFHALQSMTSGKQNTAVGAEALTYSATNSSNTAVGHRALYKTGPGLSDSVGSENTAVGA